MFCVIYSCSVLLTHGANVCCRWHFASDPEQRIQTLAFGYIIIQSLLPRSITLADLFFPLVMLKFFLPPTVRLEVSVAEEALSL